MQALQETASCRADPPAVHPPPPGCHLTKVGFDDFYAIVLSKLDQVTFTVLLSKPGSIEGILCRIKNAVMSEKISKSEAMFWQKTEFLLTKTLQLTSVT